FTRRSLLGRALVALFGWAGLRPAPAPPCPHPLHLPLCAEHAGAGRWFRTHLRLACPRCAATVAHRAYLPDAAFASAIECVIAEQACSHPRRSFYVDTPSRRRRSHRALPALAAPLCQRGRVLA